MTFQTPAETPAQGPRLPRPPAFLSAGRLPSRLPTIMHDAETADALHEDAPSTYDEGASTIDLGGGVTLRVLEIPALDALAFGIWFEGALLAVIDEPLGTA